MKNKLINWLASARGLACALMFLLPALSLVTAWGVSAISFLCIIAALYHFKPSRAALLAHWPQVRWVVLAFGANFLFATATFLARPEAGSGSVEKPLRMLLAVSALALVLAARPSASALWRGISVGALGGALLVGHQRIVLGMERPGGLLNAITTGDILMLFALLSLVAAIGVSRARTVSVAGTVAGLAGSLMTGTRGGWLAAGLAAGLVPLLAVKYGRRGGAARSALAVGIVCVLLAGAWLAPVTGVRARVEQGVADVTAYMEGGSAYTNIGIRLALWEGAAVLIAERPLLGADYATYRRELARHVAEGRLDPVVLPAVHFHNDALQALVSGGIAGLLVWLATLAAPGLFFARMLALRAAARVPALAGMVVVTSYFAFGLTEVIFWSVKASLLYALLVCMLMGLSLNVKAIDGK